MLLRAVPSSLRRPIAVSLAIAIGLGLGGPAMAQAEVPTPGAGEAVLTYQLWGDNLPDGSLGPAVGVVLDLADQTTGVVYDQSWAKCTSDADGDCSFIIPVAEVDSIWLVDVVVDPASPGWYQPPIGSGWGYIYPDGNGGLGTMGASFQLTRQNPPVPLDCHRGPMNVAIVADLDVPIGYLYIPDQDLRMDWIKEKAAEYVYALAGTNTNVELFTGKRDTPMLGWDGPFDNNIDRPLTSVQAPVGVDQLQSWISGWTLDARNPWEDTLARVANAETHFDLVIFITAGLPLISVDVKTFGWTNALKATGTRIVSITYGDYGVSWAEAMTGPVHGLDQAALNDYYNMFYNVSYSDDWMALGPVINQWARNGCYMGPPIVPPPGLGDEQDNSDAAGSADPVKMDTGGSVAQSGAVSAIAAAMMVATGIAIAVTRRRVGASG